MGIRDSEKIREALNIPENEKIVSVISVGYRALIRKCQRENPWQILQNSIKNA